MNEANITPELLKKVAGTFCTGVTIVTITNSDNLFHGMTASSFLSVSLNPPLVSFCVKKEAQMSKYLELGKYIGISILNNQQKHVSNHFAGAEQVSSEISMDTIKNCAIVKNASAWYVTSVHRIIEAGDHYLVICAVLKLDKNEGCSPLLYYSGYKNIGGQI